MSADNACIACGEEASGAHSLPVSEFDGSIVGVGYGGAWGGAPSCAGCYAIHLAATRPLDAGAEDMGQRFEDVHVAHMDATRELRRKLAKARGDLTLIGRLTVETLDDIGHTPADDGEGPMPEAIRLPFLLEPSAFRPGTRVEVNGITYRRSLDVWRKE